MNRKIYFAGLFAILLLTVVSSMSGQAAGNLKRTTFKTDKLDFGPGGTFAIIGAPLGSIKIEGTQSNEIEIAAEITVEAGTQADVDLLASVVGFTMDESTGKTAIVSVGPNDKKYLKAIGKKVPKTLMGLPFRIDYSIKVPRFCDLEIDGGKGDLVVSGVDGAMKINYLQSDATLDLVGGSLIATFGGGSVNVTIPTRSWRGRSAEVQLATGTMDVKLPVGLNADFDASILRSGKIENTFVGFKPRVRKAEFTEKSIAAKAGTGGVPLKFSVGDGTLRISEKQKGI